MDVNWEEYFAVGARELLFLLSGAALTLTTTSLVNRRASKKADADARREATRTEARHAIDVTNELDALIKSAEQASRFDSVEIPIGSEMRLRAAGLSSPDPAVRNAIEQAADVISGHALLVDYGDEDGALDSAGAVYQLHVLKHLREVLGAAVRSEPLPSTDIEALGSLSSAHAKATDSYWEAASEVAESMQLDADEERIRLGEDY